MKRWLTSFALIAGLLCPQTAYGQEFLLHINEDKKIVENRDTKSPYNAETLKSLIVSMFEQFKVIKFPREVKLYILSYEDYEKNLAAYVAPEQGYPIEYWLEAFQEQDDHIVQAYININEFKNRKLHIYLYDPSYNNIIHEVFHYILYRMTKDPGFINLHTVLQDMENRYITSKYYRDWLRKHG